MPDAAPVTTATLSPMCDCLRLIVLAKEYE
jgi:hypothetical protein